MTIMIFLIIFNIDDKAITHLKKKILISTITNLKIELMSIRWIMEMLAKRKKSQLQK